MSKLPYAQKKDKNTIPCRKEKEKEKDIFPVKKIIKKK